MRIRLRGAFAATLLTLIGCGPGAIDQPPVSIEEASFENNSGSILADPHMIVGPARGAWDCAHDCMGPFPDLLPPPFEGGVAGTYGPRGDQDVGDARWIGEVAAGVDAIAIPIVFGQDLKNTSIEVKVDGERRRTHAVWGATWRYLRVRVGHGARTHRVEIRIQDRGRGWSQWIAAGAPQILRNSDRPTGSQPMPEL
jgi:hypothetical protein